MIEPALKAFEGLLSDFTWRRLSALLALTAYLGLLFAVLEAVTGHFRLARIEHATNIVARLQEIEAKQPPASPELAAVRADLIRRLRGLTSPDTTTAPDFASLWKFLSAAAPFTLMLLIFVPGLRRGDAGAKSGMFGIGVIAVFAGFIGLLIPTFLWPWGNLLVFPLILFLCFGVFAFRWQKSQARRATLKVQQQT